MPPHPQPLIPNPVLDAEIRRIDEDRWLASRFAPAEARARLITLYALNHEIARSAEAVSQPALGDIRLAWWREAIAEIYDGKPPRAQPALLALAEVKEVWARDAFEPLIAARGRDLDPRPFAAWAELEAHIDATAGQIMRLAAQACGAVGDETLIAQASRAWGFMAWARAGRAPPVGETQATLLEPAHAAYGAVRGMAVPAEMFPALGYVALAPGYIRAVAERREPPPLLFRQVRLVGASVTGRL